MNDEFDVTTLFAHAMLVGFAQNGHLLTANASKHDVGRMVAENASSLAKGYLEYLDEQGVDDE